MEDVGQLHPAPPGTSVDHGVGFPKETAAEDSASPVNGLLDREPVNASSSDPAVGMTFDSERTAFDFYNQYARKIGFSVRWDCKTVSRKTGLTIARLFVCSKQGFRGDGKIRDIFAKYHREDTRCGCPAFMKIKLSIDGQFHVSDCNTSHNHELATWHYVHMLRSQRPRSGTGPAVSGKKKRKRKEDDSMVDQGFEMAAVADVAIDQGMSPLFDNQSYLPARRSNGMQKFDFHGLLEYFRNKQAEDPSLFYSFQFDVDEQITNVFWADRKMRVDFSHFGDVVCFDSTYKIVDYGRPLALFVGINHHRQLTVLGVALLYDETVDSLRWVFRTLLESTGGRMPVTLLTDEGEPVAAAAAAELPYVEHRLCVWQMYQQAQKALGHVFSGSKTFDEDFCKCLFDCELEVEFFESWNSMLVKHGLFDNTWLQRKFEERDRWAPPYSRATFYADIQASQRAETLTRDLRNFLCPNASSPSLSMLQFLTRFERFMDGRRRQELEANFRMTQSQPHVPSVSIIKHAARVYTSAVFYQFMGEYVAGLECIIKNEEMEGHCRVLTVEDGRGNECLLRVDFQEMMFSCSCQRFEFSGVLCGHVLACITDDVREIPERYVLKRWTRAVNAANDEGGLLGEVNAHIHSRRYDLLIRSFVPALMKAAADEEMFSCAARHRQAMEEEMDKIAGEKAAATGAAQPASYVETRNDGGDQAVWVL